MNNQFSLSPIPPNAWMLNFMPPFLMHSGIAFRYVYCTCIIQEKRAHHMHAPYTGSLLVAQSYIQDSSIWAFGGTGDSENWSYIFSWTEKGMFNMNKNLHVSIGFGNKIVLMELNLFRDYKDFNKTKKTVIIPILGSKTFNNNNKKCSETYKKSAG